MQTQRMQKTLEDVHHEQHPEGGTGEHSVSDKGGEPVHELRLLQTEDEWIFQSRGHIEF